MDVRAKWRSAVVAGQMKGREAPDSISGNTKVPESNLIQGSTRREMSTAYLYDQ